MNRWKCIGNEEVSRKSPKRSQFALALVYEWFAVRTRNGEIELENEANLRLVMGRPEGIGRDGLGARREECPVACESEETESAVMEKRQNKAKLVWL